MAITRLWFFTLQPTTSPTDPTFLTLWSDILTLCASYTPPPGPSSSQAHVAQLSHCPPTRPHHFLLQTTTTDSSSSSSSSSPPTFVFITSYPSLALFTQADAICTTRYYRPHLAPLVQHRALRQLDMEDAEAVPALLCGGGGKGDKTVTVTIASRDPLRSEVAEALSHGDRRTRIRTPVPPPEEEISGADVYQEAGAAEEGKRWVRIARGSKMEEAEGDVEAFLLREVMAR